MTRERYLVIVDGSWSEQATLSLDGALALALRHVDSMSASEVIVADARTYMARALWWRVGLRWRMRSAEGWERRGFSAMSAIDAA